MLEVRVESKGFDSPLLRDITLTIGRGERLALVGPSGSGKTTLLNIIAGLDTDFRGKRRLPGRDFRIAYMFQEPRLLPWRTVGRNLSLVTGDPSVIPSLLEEVELEQAIDRYPRQLSLGMARRVALARALAINPDLLLLDEPLASLDPDTAVRMRLLINAVLGQRPEMSLLMVSHDPEDARQLDARVLRLDPESGGVLLPSEEKTASPGQLLKTGVASRIRSESGSSPGCTGNTRIQ